MAATCLLLVSQNPADIEFAQEVASTANLRFEQARDRMRAVELIREDETKIIFADATDPDDYQELEAAIQEKIGLFSDKIDPNRIHFISDRSLADSKHLIQSPLFGHFIVRQYGDPKEAGQHYGNLVNATLQERAFGLATLMKPGTKIQSVKVVSSTQKQSAVDAVKNYVSSAKFNPRAAVMIANAVDEILMNAIFDAPVDDIGRPLYQATARSTSIKLQGKASVEMQIGFDGRYVGITAIDNFGSLDKAKLLSHISKVYSKEEYKVRTTVAGAGIGLARIFNLGGGSLFFASEHSQRTEATLFFKKAGTFREFKNQFHFLSTQFYF